MEDRKVFFIETNGLSPKKQVQIIKKLIEEYKKQGILAK